MRWVEHMARMAGKRGTCKLLAIRPEPERLIQKFSDWFENNIKKKSQTFDWRDRAGLIWLILRTSGGLLWTW